MRLALVSVLLSASIAGLGFSYWPEDQALIFITAPVERGEISALVKAAGPVEAVVTVNVGSQLSGRIADVFVNFNDPVKAGQPIARLDQEIFSALDAGLLGSLIARRKNRAGLVKLGRALSGFSA